MTADESKPALDEETTERGKQTSPPRTTISERREKPRTGNRIPGKWEATPAHTQRNSKPKSRTIPKQELAGRSPSRDEPGQSPQKP